MAGRCDLVQREVKMPRIDHSHIYFENDRLKEALDNFKDDLDRRQYRQWMAREEEIQKLKKASGLLDQEELDSRGNPIVKKPPSRRGPRRGHAHHTLMEKQTATASNSRKSNETLDDSHDGVSSSERQHGKAGSSQRTKKISVRMPNADVDVIDGGFSDLENEVDGNFMDSGPYGKTVRKPQTVLKTLESKMSPRKKQTRYGRTVSRPRKFNIERLMEALRLKQWPTEWYSTVLQPPDVPSLKAAGTSGRSSPSHSAKGRRSRPQTSVEGTRSSQSVASRRDVQSADPSGRQSSVGFSTVVCHGQQTSKTKRQLLKMVNEDGRGDLRPKSAVEQRLMWNRETSRHLDHKVKDFVKSLEDLNKKSQKPDMRTLNQQL